MFLTFAVVSGLMLTIGCNKDDDENGDEKVLSPREKAIKDYEENYLGSDVFDPVWTGNTNGCVAGTISQEARDKVIQRLNYFRRLVGLSDDVVENVDQHAGCMEASLIFKAQSSLSHHPPQHWACWTQAGYDAAATGNIAWGSSTYGDFCVHTVHGVSGFIEDAGAHNTAVGHRAWFFMPGLQKLGIGSTNTTSCMQWKDNYQPTGPAPEFIAYPPEGYMPNKITYPRWSFTIPSGATFTNATVKMTDENGVNVSLNIVNKPSHQPGSFPLRHLVWEPNVDVEFLMDDVTYTVTIDNVQGAPKTTYTYDVTIIPVSGIVKRTEPRGEDDRIILNR